MYKKANVIAVAGLAAGVAAWPTTTCTESASAAAPSSSALPDCWSSCFSQAGVTAESDLCGNTAVDKCVHDTCSADLSAQYWSWYDGYCGVPSSTVPVSIPVYSTSAPVVSSSSIPVYPVSSIPSSTVPVSVPVYPASSTFAPVPSASSFPSCWGACFAKYNIQSEESLCGNTDVDQCIQDTCSSAEDEAYWAWYETFCPAPSASVSTPVGPIPSTTAPALPSGTPDCWSTCFAENDVTSEASLCGNDNVSKCIYETCSPSLDKAYWEWYDGYCSSGSTVFTTSTITIPCSTYSSTYVTGSSTVTSYWTVTVASGVPTYPASGVPPPAFGAPPASGIPPYPTGPASSTLPPYAVGTTGVARASASSSWSVPSTGGASAITKPSAAIFACAALALIAFF